MDFKNPVSVRIYIYRFKLYHILFAQIGFFCNIFPCKMYCSRTEKHELKVQVPLNYEMYFPHIQP